jgi:hypothetical protein
MPLLPFAKQQIHTDFTFPHCLLVGFGGPVAAHPLQRGILDVAAEAASLAPRRALRFERTGVTGGPRGAVPQ